MRNVLAMMVLATVLIEGTSALANDDFLNANVLMRVKRLVAGPLSGTAFTIEVDGNQYIITAKHVVAALTKDKGEVDLYDDQSKKTTLHVDVLRCADPIDIAVLIPPTQVSVTYSLPPELKGAVFSQTMFFVGFPFADYTLTSHDGQSSIGFIRRATFSAQENGNGFTRLYLDGTNNVGFSGAPVVYRDLGQPGNVLKVAGVISGYRTDFSEVQKLEPVDSANIPADALGNHSIIQLADGSFKKIVGTGTFVASNTGVIIAYAIDHAVDLIRKSGLKGPKVE